MRPSWEADHNSARRGAIGWSGIGCSNFSATARQRPRSFARWRRCHIDRALGLISRVRYPQEVKVESRGNEEEAGVQTAIATVSLSGELNEKLEAIAAAGFKARRDV